MSLPTTDFISDLFTTGVKKEPKKRGPKPKMNTEKYDYIDELLTKVNKKEEKEKERQIKKQAKKEEAAEAKKKPALDQPYKSKMLLYLGKKLRKDDPDYDAIREQVEKNQKERNEYVDSLFKPIVTTVVPIKKYKTPMDEIREVMIVINEEEEKERKKQDRLKKMMEDDEEESKKYKSEPLKQVVKTPQEQLEEDYIYQLVKQSNEQNKNNTGKGVKKRNTKKNKKISKKRNSKRNSKIFFFSL